MYTLHILSLRAKLNTCVTIITSFFLQRCGVWGDWENPYLTLHPDYEAAQVGVNLHISIVIHGLLFVEVAYEIPNSDGTFL